MSKQGVRRGDARGRVVGTVVLGLLTMIGAVIGPALRDVSTNSGAPASALLHPNCTPGPPIRSGPSHDNVVAFTFDDGPNPEHTPDVMDLFESYGWRATFFVVGPKVRKHPDLARAIVERGHSIGGHSMTHSYDPGTIARELLPTAAAIEQATGVWPVLFRSPGLTESPIIDAAAVRSYFCNISTTGDLGDWNSPRDAAGTLCARFKVLLRPGFIALLHDGGPNQQTVDALPCMLQHTADLGYRAVTVDSMLTGRYELAPWTPPDHTPVRYETHVSALGETLVSIAAQYNITLSELLAANPTVELYMAVGDGWQFQIPIYDGPSADPATAGASIGAVPTESTTVLGGSEGQVAVPPDPSNDPVPTATPSSGHSTTFNTMPPGHWGIQGSG